MRLRCRLFAAALAAALLLPGLAAAQMNPFAKSGFELADGDTALIREAVAVLQKEGAAVGDSASWANPESGNAGTVTYVGDSSYKELSCRRLQHDITLKNAGQDYRFIVDRCKMPDGSWKAL
jgi:surface antigen